MRVLAAETMPNTPRSRVAEYATAEEFCLIFSREMESLYTLALALTGDPEKAEQCFVSALEDCHEATAVFRQWAPSWARLAVIESAMKIVKPTAHGVTAKPGDAKPTVGIHPDAEYVMRLNNFDRFVFVLSVLDKYSVRDCAVLMKCRPQEVSRARQRTLEFIAGGDVPFVRPPVSAMGARIPA